MLRHFRPCEWDGYGEKNSGDRVRMRAETMGTAADGDIFLSPCSTLITLGSQKLEPRTL